MTPPSPDAKLELDFVADAARAREAAARRRSRQALGLSVAVTLVWLVYVVGSGQFERVFFGWRASLTALFGSFVAGSTPQGGGAVAFPVFTKVMNVPAEVARSFSLAVQTVGMGTAALAIFIVRRRVAWRAVAVALPVASASFVVAYLLLTDSEKPWRPAIIPGPYIKVSFTLVVAAMAFIVYLGARVSIREVTVDIPTINPRVTSALVALAAVGGLTAALTGSGADLFVYLALTVLLGIDPKVGVPTSVVVMACVSAVGFALVTLDGQMSVGLANGGADVVTLGGDAVTDLGSGSTVEPAFGSDGRALAAEQVDLFGMWLSAVPMVTWGAPLGSWFAARLSARALVMFVAVLAALEMISTIIFLPDLRENPALLLFALSGAVLLFTSLAWLARNRGRVLGLPGVALEASLTRPRLDVASDYSDSLRGESRLPAGDDHSPDTAEPDPDSPDAASPQTDSPDTDSPDTDSPDTDSPDTDSPDTDGPHTDGDDERGDDEAGR